MQDVIESIVFGFSEILHYKTMKLALAIGSVVVLVWIVFGYMMWGSLIGFASYFIDLVPFSLLRSNGAWMLSSFLWFSLVIITFAVILAFFGTYILERVSKEKYSSFSVLIVFASAVVWALVWFFDGGYIHTQFLKLLNWLPFETVKASLAYLLGLYFIYSAIVVSMLLVTSFFSETLLEEINEKHFPYEPLLDENEFEESENKAKDIVIYTVASIIAFPILFIPILNFLIQIILWIWLIRDTFVNDSAALIIKNEEKVKLAQYKYPFIIISMITTLFNFIPIFNIFGPFFGEITMFHYMKTIKKEF